MCNHAPHKLLFEFLIVKMLVTPQLPRNQTYELFMPCLFPLIIIVLWGFFRSLTVLVQSSEAAVKKSEIIKAFGGILAFSLRI